METATKLPLTYKDASSPELKSSDVNSKEFVVVLTTKFELLNLAIGKLPDEILSILIQPEKLCTLVT